MLSCLKVPCTSGSDARAEAVELGSPDGRRVSSDRLISCSRRNQGRSDTSFSFHLSATQAQAETDRSVATVATAARCVLTHQ